MCVCVSARLQEEISSQEAQLRASGASGGGGGGYDPSTPSALEQIRTAVEAERKAQVRRHLCLDIRFFVHVQATWDRLDKEESTMTRQTARTLKNRWTRRTYVMPMSGPELETSCESSCPPTNWASRHGNGHIAHLLSGKPYENESFAEFHQFVT